MKVTSKRDSDGMRPNFESIAAKIEFIKSPSQPKPAVDVNEVSEAWCRPSCPEPVGKSYGIRLAPPLPQPITEDYGSGSIALPPEPGQSVACHHLPSVGTHHSSQGPKPSTPREAADVAHHMPMCAEKPKASIEYMRSVSPPSSASSLSTLTPGARRHEQIKAAIVFWLVVALWAAVWVVIWLEWDTWEKDNKESDCDAMSKSARNSLRSCDACGSGTIILPIFGEFEKSWPMLLRRALYFFALFWMFLGMGLVCDGFMAGIEEITSQEYTIWKEVADGVRHKFHVKIWNPTVANLTLMALGSSAPEILLSATELVGNEYFAGKLGPSTIVGSAAFNLLVISAVCVSAIPAPFTRKIKDTDVFLVTTTFSLFAYIWLLVILLIRTPEKVDLLEGILTLAFFPILVLHAFSVDKGWCRRRKPLAPAVADSMLPDRDASVTVGHMASMAASWSAQTYAGVLKDEVVDLIGKKKDRDEKKETTSKAKIRQQTTGFLTGGFKHIKGMARSGSNMSKVDSAEKVVTFGFERSKYSVIEGSGFFYLKVVASAPSGTVVHIKYRTVPGTAARDVRYKHTEGFLSFGPCTRERRIEIPIIDNQRWESNEEFSVELSGLSVQIGRVSVSSMYGSLSTTSMRLPTRKTSNSSDSFVLGISTATITVIDDDEPGGVLGFPVDEVQVTEGQSFSLSVARTENAIGTVTCKYETIDGSAIAGRDYEAAKGTLKFNHGERHKTIDITILANEDHMWETAENFSVKLTEAGGGAVFDFLSEGGFEFAMCDIIIVAEQDAPCCVKCVRRCCANRDRWKKGLAQWCAQVEEAIYCGGSAEEQAEAGITDWAFHILSLVWKVLFSIVPPPALMGGWPCFLAALFMIGVVTAVTGDVASLLGCCLDIPDNATAITLVALGTSLPDTFASRMAAQQDDSADNAIGNITGSNSVNVFLGIGISWTIGAVYWGRHGATTKWLDWMYEGESYKDRYILEYPEGGFVVPAGSLSITVAVYLICAIVCLALLCFRRKSYGGELGGPACAQRRDAIFLVCLWVVYIVLSLLGDSMMATCDLGEIFC